MHPLSGRQHDAFDYLAKMPCREGNLKPPYDSSMQVCYNPRW
jgi:hypothetical protein